MEKAKELLAAYGVPEALQQEMAYAIYHAIENMYDKEDVRSVAEDMGVDLTEKQVRQAVILWRDLESYGELDRVGIEYAIEETLRGE